MAKKQFGKRGGESEHGLESLPRKRSKPSVRRSHVRKEGSAAEEGFAKRNRQIEEGRKQVLVRPRVGVQGRCLLNPDGEVIRNTSKA